MIQKSNDEDIKNSLLKNRNLSLIFYTLSQTPSHLAELARALNLPVKDVINNLMFLKNNKLIRKLAVNGKSKNGVVKDFYPIILQKQKKAIKGLSLKDGKEVLKTMNFYFISNKGLEFLSYARKLIFENGGDKNGRRKKYTL
jgi:hypothetical protein